VIEGGLTPRGTGDRVVGIGAAGWSRLRGCESKTLLKPRKLRWVVRHRGGDIGCTSFAVIAL